MGIKIPFMNREIIFKKLDVTERIVEYPFVLQNLENKRGKILDVGCCDSDLSLQLASLGHKVWGIDVRKYENQHPNLIFVQSDISKTPFPSEFFDTIIAVSTIEHIGLGYGKTPLYNNGDKLAMKEIYRILKPSGKLIITLPVGRKKVTPTHRIYDTNSLRKLLKKFKIKNMEYYIKKTRKLG